jgi:hypothetical protein
MSGRFVELFPIDDLEKDAILSHSLTGEPKEEPQGIQFHYLLKLVDILMCMIICATHPPHMG